MPVFTVVCGIKKKKKQNKKTNQKQFFVGEDLVCHMTVSLSFQGKRKVARVLAQCYWTRLGGRQRNRNSLGERSPVLASPLSRRELRDRADRPGLDYGERVNQCVILRKIRHIIV